MDSRDCERLIHDNKLIGHASMQTPQLGHEWTCSLEKPLRECLIGMPAFRIGIRRISAGMCIYLLNGSTNMNTPKAIEYAHQTGNALVGSL